MPGALLDRDHEVHGEGASRPETDPLRRAFTDQFALDHVCARAGVEE